jgi:hypothetical protein
MLKSERKILEELSLKAFGKKHHYKKIIDHGLLYRDPETKQAARIHLTPEGIKLYLEKTIKVREDFLKAATVLKDKELNDESNTTTDTEGSNSNSESIDEFVAKRC